MDVIDLVANRMIGFIPVLLSLTVHEWAHAWTAFKLGDDTAKMLGRVSLNPVDHIDPVGTLLLPLLGVPFGWAKPVPVNPTRFRTSISMPMGMLLTAAAGPLSNLVLALIGSCALLVLSMGFSAEFADQSAPQVVYAVVSILRFFVVINVILACFNLLPIPPLDGSRIVDATIPSALRPAWEQFSTLGPFLLIGVIVLPNIIGFNLLAWPIAGVNQLLERIIPGG